VAGPSKLSRRLSEFLGVALFAAALIWLIALVTYDPSDPAWFFNTGSNAPPVNFIGRVGAFLAELSFQLFGYASYLVPVILVLVGWHLFWCTRIDAIYTKLVGTLCLFGSACALLALVIGRAGAASRPLAGGGYFGERLAAWLGDSLNRPGSLIVLVTVLMLSIIPRRSSRSAVLRRDDQTVKAGASGLTAAIRSRREERRREKQRQEVIAKHTKRAKDAPSPAAAATAPVASRPDSAEPRRPASAEPAVAAARPPSIGVRRPSTTPVQGTLQDADSAVKAPAERRKGSYALPPVALLDASKVEQKIDERELMDAARLLEEKCREFAVEGNVVQIHPGPVVTTFEFKPDAGVKYAKITSLADDLSLALRAESVLIERCRANRRLIRFPT
jgi:S-DNA-T family DNA segregation ATPase FtsK/SpoIIIE